MRSYDPAEFLSKLASNELQTSREVALYGLVRANEGSSSTIAFSSSPSCDDWLTVPLDLVESIEHLTTMKCQDHEHPVGRLRFRRPDPGREDVTFLLDLIARLQTSLSRAIDTARNVRGGSFSGDDCTQDCQIIYSAPKGGLVICCWCPNGDVTCSGIA